MMKFLSANKWWLGAVVIVALAGGTYWYIRSSAPPTFTTYTVAKGNVVESVNEPGTVSAENNVNLSFQESGEIASVNVVEGQTVGAGTALASLSDSSLNAGVLQANAALAAAQAELDGLASGTRPEEIAIDQTAVTNALASLSATEGSAYTAVSDAVTNQADNLFSNPQSNSPIFLIPNTDSQLTINIQSQRVAVGPVIAAFYAALNAMSSTPSTLFTIANNTLSQAQSYLDAVALATSNAISGSSLPAATLAQYKVDIGVARTEVGAAITALTGAESGYTSAEGALTLAVAGATPQQLEAQKAAVLQAQAAASAAQVALSNATLVAPFAGTVENLTAQVGQVVSPSMPVLTLVNQSGLKIVTYVSDTDVAKVVAGEKADVTLDAFGTGTSFAATVTTVGTTQTTVNGSPAYEVILHFTSPEPGVSDGMTGNVNIIAAEHDNVIEVPSLLVINNNNSYFVLVSDGKTVTQRPVTIGITGASTTEITSGLNVGDQITNF